MNNRTYHLDPESVIRSLHSAFLLPRDYSMAILRLTNVINRLPHGQLQITHYRNQIYFYINRQYLRKDSDLLYSLARKRYCETLLQVITLYEEHPTASADRSTLTARRTKAFGMLEQLNRDYSKGNLELERIILTPQQYKWYYGRYRKKRFPTNQTSADLTIPQGDPVLSKSEQRIGYELDRFAVPCHYEEELLINVQRLVSSLETELRQRKLLQGRLYSYHGYTCVWNVPAELSWLNAPGSIWRSYDDRTGCLRLHPDYTIMLADGSLLYWEHEGLMHQFFYRTNALERVEIMHQAGGVPKSRLIETNESQANEPETLREIIQNQVLPELWF